MQETYSGKVTTYTYDALGQRIRVNDPDDPTAGEGGGRLRIVPASPLRAPTPGQTAAIYSAGRVLGGGFIERDTKDTI